MLFHLFNKAKCDLRESLKVENRFIYMNRKLLLKFKTYLSAREQARKMGLESLSFGPGNAQTTR